MSNNCNNNQQKDNSLERWRNLTLSTSSASSQPQQQPQSVQRQCQSQPDQRRQQLQFQSEQRQHQSQPIQRQIPLSQPKQPQQQQKQKKKKGRGNRQLQRYRAKLRRQGLNNETITTLINNYQVTTDQGQNQEQSAISNMDVELFVVPARNQENVQKTKSVKRKRDIQAIGSVTTSMSQMSLSNLLPKKRQRSTAMGDVVEENIAHQPTSNYTPNYLKVSDQVFKQMLSKSLAGTESIIQSLNTPEKLQFVRTYAHLLNNIFYLKLEQDFSESYDKTLTTEGIWSSTSLEKQLTKENNLYRFKFKTKIQFEKHRKLIFDRLQKAENDFNKHKQQPVDRSIDMHRLSTMIPAFVRQGQHKLSKEFERKKRILQFEAHDHCLVKTFYNLKPTENQICSAKIMWQATKDKLQAENEMTILKQRISTKRLPFSFHLLDHSIDNIEQMLQRPVFEQDKRATLLSRRLKTIAQFKYDLMTLSITTAEETIRSHTKIIANEKKKMIDTTSNGQTPLPKSLIQLMNTITERQTNMLQRNEVILKQKLSFFDDAPTTEENMAGVVGAVL